MSLDTSTLSKGEKKKLENLRKSIGDDLGTEAFEKYQKQVANQPAADPVALRIREIFARFEDDRSFNLGNKGYTIRRAKGKGATGFVVTKNG